MSIHQDKGLCGTTIVLLHQHIATKVQPPTSHPTSGRVAWVGVLVELCVVVPLRGVGCLRSYRESGVGFCSYV